MLRLVTEYEWRGKLNPGISDLGHSFRAICSLHLLYIVHEKAVWHPEKTVKTGPNGHPSDFSLSSGLLSACEKSGVRGRHSQDLLGSGPPPWLLANCPNHISSHAHARIWPDANLEKGSGKSWASPKLLPSTQMLTFLYQNHSVSHEGPRETTLIWPLAIN